MKRFLALMMAAVCLFGALPQAMAEEPNPIPVLSPEEITPTPKGIHHYMLICIDSWAADLKKSGNHTDGMILVTVDEYAGRVMLTSFIRDMLIQRPDGDFGRLNNILDYFGRDKGGIEALITTLNTHFDLEIEKYIVVDFRQVENIIDAIGGVDIEVTAREANYLRNYPLSASSTTPALSGAGTYHFTGHAAVIYMRIRKVANIDGETQDVGRTRRARTVLTTIADSLKDITYDEAVALLDVVLENTVLTNMSAADIADALNLALEMKGTKIESIRMPIDGTFEPMPVSGMATQQIDYIKNREALHEFLIDPFVVVEDE
ncbi:MAG: LCP family protein [Clostridia bacterium]|nr:LCP family protein [Clostridia bacterium]